MVFGVPRKSTNQHFVWDISTKTEFSNVWLLGAVLEGLGAVLGGLGSIFGRLGAVFGRLGLGELFGRGFDLLERLREPLEAV